MPGSGVVLVIDYRHTDFDANSPDSLPAGFLGFSSFTAVTGIRNTISYTDDYLKAMAHIRAARDLAFEAEGSWNDHKRENTDEWDIVPGATRTGKAELCSSYVPFGWLRLRASYKHTERGNPAYNEEPSRADEAAVSASFNPWTMFSMFVEYQRASGSRGSILYDDSVGQGGGAKDRSTEGDNLVSFATLFINEQVSMSVGVNYWKDRIRQDLVYQDGSNYDFLDPGVKNMMITRNYNASLSYVPSGRFDITAGANRTHSEEAFYPGIPAALQPSSIAGFSAMDIVENIYSLAARYRPGRMEIGLNYTYANLDNKVPNSANPEDFGGNAHVILVSVTSRW